MTWFDYLSVLQGMLQDRIIREEEKILVEAYMKRGTVKFRKLEQLTGSFRTQTV